MTQIKVLVVDDSVVIRRLITSVLNEDPSLMVVGTAANGLIALDKIEQLQPDLITLDIEMPELDGIGTLKRLRRTHPKLPVIMFSTLTENGASATLDALALGASDYVTKPANVGSVAESLAAVRDQLVPKIKALTGRRNVPSGAHAGLAAPALRIRTPGLASAPEVLLIGSSTGGPDALSAVIPNLSADYPLPVAVVQHMPPVFTKMLAQRLNAVSNLEVREAAHGDVMRPGQVLIAPGDHHLVLRRDGLEIRAFLNQDTQENFVRPAVDVLFRSASEVYGGRAVAVILTGMGHDGRDGAALLAAKGAYVIAQDEASSVVWGMPGAVSDAGLADEVLPLGQIVASVLKNSGPPLRFFASQPKKSAGSSL